MELQTNPVITAKITDMSFGGLNVQLETEDRAFLSGLLINTDIPVRLVIPSHLDRLILYESPLDVTLHVVRVNPTTGQMGATWGNINPVVLSTLIQSLITVKPKSLAQSP